MPQGPIAVRDFNTRAGGATPALAGLQGELIVGAVTPPLYEAAIAGQAMIGANSAGVTTSAALATTYVGLCLSNPAGSGVNLVLTRVQGLLSVAPAAETTFGLITGYAAGGITVHTTPLTPANSFIHDTAAAPLAELDSACTLVGTPAWTRWLHAAPAATSIDSFDVDLQGSIVLPPGAYVAVGTNIAGPASGFWGTFQWLELPVAS